MHLQYSTWSYRPLITLRNATTKADWINQGILTCRTLFDIGAYNHEDADTFEFAEGVARNGVGQHRTTRFDTYVCTIALRTPVSYNAKVYSTTLRWACKSTLSDTIQHYVLSVD